jgi:hypothetical protein
MWTDRQTARWGGVGRGPGALLNDWMSLLGAVERSGGQPCGRLGLTSIPTTASSTASSTLMGQ